MKEGIHFFALMCCPVALPLVRCGGFCPGVGAVTRGKHSELVSSAALPDLHVCSLS